MQTTQQGAFTNRRLAHFNSKYRFSITCFLSFTNSETDTDTDVNGYGYGNTQNDEYKNYVNMEIKVNGQL